MSTLRVDTITDEAGTGPVSFPNGATGLEPFKYNAVSGATQALDVGSYNFFDAGTLTADTTVSFSNVPTEARWTYTAAVGYSAATPWDASEIAFARSFYVAANTTGLRNLFFKPDGTAMYVVDEVGVKVNEYSLSTAWDIRGLSYVQSFSVSAQESIPAGLFFKPDGTAMYVLGRSGDSVYEYSLSTAWDISTASYVRLKSISAELSFPSGLFFKPDGTAMYATGYSRNEVNQYSLSTAWNISTASYASFLDVEAQEGNPRDVFFKPDGTIMYVIGDTQKAIQEYSLSTPWDVSTASHVGSTSVVGEDAAPYGLFFKPDGTTVYVSGAVNTSVFEYVLGSPNTVTLPLSIQNPPIETGGAFDVSSYTFFTADGGTNVYLISEEVI